MYNAEIMQLANVNAESNAEIEESAARFYYMYLSLFLTLAQFCHPILMQLSALVLLGSIRSR